MKPSYFAAPGLKIFSAPRRRDYALTYIAEVVADFLQVPRELLFRKGRQRTIVEARQICMYLSREYTNATFKDIGMFYGQLDHTTTIHSCNRVHDFIDTEPEYVEKIKHLRKLIMS